MEHAKRSTKFAVAAVAALGIAAVAVPVVAQQGQMQHGGMMAGGMSMMGHHGGKMGGGMGMMGGAQSYAMATFDTSKDGTLSPEEMTAGIDEFSAMHAAHSRPMTVRAFRLHDADGGAVICGRLRLCKGFLD